MEEKENAHSVGVETGYRLPQLPPALYVPLYPPEWKPVETQTIAGHEDGESLYDEKPEARPREFPALPVLKIVASGALLFLIGYLITQKTRVL